MWQTQERSWEVDPQGHFQGDAPHLQGHPPHMSFCWCCRYSCCLRMVQSGSRIRLGGPVQRAGKAPVSHMGGWGALGLGQDLPSSFSAVFCCAAHTTGEGGTAPGCQAKGQMCHWLFTSSITECVKTAALGRLLQIQKFNNLESMNYGKNAVHKTGGKKPITYLVTTFNLWSI